MTAPGAPPAGRPQAVLFDLDGTLIDSAPDLAGAANDMREARGLPRLPLAHFRPMVGSGARGMVARALGVGPDDAQFIALRDEFLQRYEARMTRETRWSRAMSLGLAALIAAANTVVLVLLIRKLVEGKASDGNALLIGSAQVWLTNVVAYALLYWQLDRGGAVARTQQDRELLPAADFRFSQDENDDAIVEVAKGSSKNADWVPTLVDYLYVSITNSTAFSPTDTMPLTSRAKALMALESVSALVLSVVVIAHGVGSLK